jgi:zinc protease
MEAPVRWWLRLTASSVILAAVAAAAPTFAQQVPRIEFEQFTLPNGLQVILHRDTSVPLVAVNVWYHVGSGDELPGRTGFAHLFEHIMFMGSQNVPPGMFDGWLEAAGANNNGSTTEDRTNYYVDAPSNALPLALWLDADRMGWLLPTMDQEKLDLQRGVVQNERRQGVDNVPYGRARETLQAALLPPDHPYSWPVIGSMADLGAATLDDVQQFFRLYYAPNNASLVVAGDFEPAEVRRLVSEYFGPIPRGPAIERRVSVPPPQIARDTFLVLEDRVQLPRLYYLYPSVKLFGPGDAELEMVAHVLAGGRSSRLYRRLVYELQVAQDVTAFQSGRRLDGAFWIMVTPKPEQSPAEMARLVDEEIQRIVRDGVTEQELQRVKNTYAARFLDGMASVGGFRGKADLLNHYNYFAGTPDFVQQDAARYQDATATDLQRHARELFARPRVVLTVVPEGRTELMVRGDDS